MLDLCDKNSECNSSTIDTCIAGSASMWVFCDSHTQESTLSGNLNIKMTNPVEYYPTSEQLGVHFQEQDTSSTQSTGQSYPDVTSIETKAYGQNILSSDVCLSASSGTCGMDMKDDEDQSKSVMAFQDCGLSNSPIHCKQLACFPLAYPDPYSCGFAYSLFPAVHSQAMGLTAARVPLPLRPPNHEPIYVNPKQYRAILRRRQFRARLEAQNKLSKVRKPYLHESRHRHALNRVRGSGGRFLDTKKLHKSNPSLNTNGQDMNTSPMDSGDRDAENDKEGSSISTYSDIASNTNSSLDLCENSFSVSPSSHTGGSISAGGGTQRYLSVLQ